MSRAGYIYFLCDDQYQFVKIGRSKNLEQRINELKKRNEDKNLILLAAIHTPDDVTHETMIHRLFVSERVRGVNAKKGEWYYFKGAVVEFIKIAEEKGINEAVNFIATNRKSDREDWRTWKELVIQNINYQTETNGSLNLRA